MDFDFNLILVPATLFFVAVWLLDKFVLKQRQTKGKGNENFIITWAYDFWPVLAVVLVLRSFLYEPSIFHQILWFQHWKPVILSWSINLTMV